MKRLFLILPLALFLLVGCGETPAATTTQSAPVATEASSPTPATSQSIHYPPTMEADLRGLSAKGDASTIHEFHSESVGMTGACPQPKREVAVDPSITGQQLAEDLLAYFYAQHLDNPCGSIVFAYHTQDEATDGTYSAGRIMLGVTDANGQQNTDPNASDLKHKLMLDVGPFSSSQEYTVTY